MFWIFQISTLVYRWWWLFPFEFIRKTASLSFISSAFNSHWIDVASFHKRDKVFLKSFFLQPHRTMLQFESNSDGWAWVGGAGGGDLEEQRWWGGRGGDWQGKEESFNWNRIQQKSLSIPGRGRCWLWAPLSGKKSPGNKYTPSPSFSICEELRQGWPMFLCLWLNTGTYFLKCLKTSWENKERKC